MNKTEQTFE